MEGIKGSLWNGERRYPNRLQPDGKAYNQSAVQLAKIANALGIHVEQLVKP
jgi:hypothetical protein